MFDVAVNTDNLDFQRYLNIEGTLIDEHAYEFSSSERAAYVISYCLYQQLKLEALSEVIGDTQESESEKSSFMLFIPYDYEAMWRKRVEEHLNYYFIQQNVGEINIEGFIPFRLRDIKQQYVEYIEAEYEHFTGITGEPSPSIDALVDYMDTQPIQTQEMIIETHEDGHITLTSDGKYVYKELMNEQENIIVQSIFGSPERVRVIDDYDVLRKESIIVLKQLFGAQIVFEKGD